MKFAINQIYDPDFNQKLYIPRDVLVIHQQQDQESGIEQQKAEIKRRKKDLASRVAYNVKMAGIINIARKNLIQGNVIRVGM